MTKIAERTASIREAGGRIASSEGKGPRRLIRAIGWEPGAEYVEGASGRYPVAAIKRDFAETYPVGTRMKANHDGMCESGGDIRRVMAKTDGPWDFREDGAYVPARFSEQWAGYIDDFGDVIGVSIAAGVALQAQPEHDGGYDEHGRPIDENGNVLDLRPIVERFLSASESPYNSIDFVEAPGADGRIVQALESAKSHFEHANMREAAMFASHYLDQRRREASEAALPQKIKEGIAMDKEEFQAMLGEAVTGIETRIVEKLAPAPVETPETRFESVAEAAFEAGLTKGSRAAVYERVRAGATVEAAVEAEKAREAEVEEAIKARFEQEHGGYAVGEGEGKISHEAEFQSLLTNEKVI